MTDAVRPGMLEDGGVMWWTIASVASACEPTELDSIRPFPAAGTNGVGLDMEPTVVFTGRDATRAVSLVDADDHPVAASIVTLGGPVSNPEEGLWIVKMQPEQLLEKNAEYRLVVDRDDEHHEFAFHTGNAITTGAGSGEPSLEILEVAAPISSSDSCKWPVTTRYTVRVDPGAYAPRGLLTVRRGAGGDDLATADVVYAGPADQPAELTLALANDPAQSCLAVQIDALVGAVVSTGWYCGDIPPAPSYQDTGENGKTTGGHGCETSPGGFGWLALVGLLARRRNGGL
jgi:hypothetical protein